MKLFRPALLACFLALTACKKEPVVATTPPEEKTADTIGSSQLQKLAVSLDGLWISDDYLTNIGKTGSIYKNKDYKAENRLLGFTLHKDKLATGKTELLGFTEHEGGNVYPLIFNNVKNRFEYDPKRAAEHDGPTELSLYPVKDNLMEIAYIKPKAQKDRYRKIGDSKSDIDQLDETLNLILFEGTYTDSINGKTILFRRDGKVQGIPGYGHYELLYDFGEGLEFDTVFLWQGESNGERVTYHFKRDRKILRLYATEVNEEKMEYTISEKPSFVLIQQ